MERELFGVKADIFQCIRRPKIRCAAVRIENLGIKLTCSMDAANSESISVPLDETRQNISRNVAVNDLGHPYVPTISHQIECLCLYTCRSHCSPAQVFLFEFRPWYRFGLLADRLNCRGSIEWFLSPGHVGNPGYSVQLY